MNREGPICDCKIKLWHLWDDNRIDSMIFYTQFSDFEVCAQINWSVMKWSFVLYWITNIKNLFKFLLSDYFELFKNVLHRNVEVCDLLPNQHKNNQLVLHQHYNIYQVGSRFMSIENIRQWEPKFIQMDKIFIL